ncbi:MAG: flagellar assembly protein FliH [Chromatiales bacterium]|nr:flagellar assembly protein FliH [Chromatiales bacterium]
MSSPTRIIPGDRGDSVQSWQAPEVSTGRRQTATPRVEPLTAQRIEQIERQAYDEGFKRGRADGLKSGMEEAKLKAGHLDRLLTSLAKPVEELDQAVEHELVDLVTAIARQLVRREVRTDPGQIVAAVREALAVLPNSDRRLRLFLHPEDARVVRETLHIDELERPWAIVEDPTISRGGVRLATDVSNVDATLETRLNAVVASLWGGDRREDEATSP